jgi:hypothetical protein
VESSCECGNEPLGSIKCWGIIVATQLVPPPRVVLSPIELVSLSVKYNPYDVLILIPATG